MVKEFESDLGENLKDEITGVLEFLEKEFRNPF